MAWSVLKQGHDPILHLLRALRLGDVGSVVRQLHAFRHPFAAHDIGLLPGILERLRRIIGENAGKLPVLLAHDQWIAAASETEQVHGRCQFHAHVCAVRGRRGRTVHAIGADPVEDHMLLHDFGERHRLEFVPSVFHSFEGQIPVSSLRIHLSHDLGGQIGRQDSLVVREHGGNRFRGGVAEIHAKVGDAVAQRGHVEEPLLQADAVSVGEHVDAGRLGGDDGDPAVSVVGYDDRQAAVLGGLADPMPGEHVQQRGPQGALLPSHERLERRYLRISQDRAPVHELGTIPVAVRSGFRSAGEDRGHRLTGRGSALVCAPDVGNEVFRRGVRGVLA